MSPPGPRTLRLAPLGGLGEVGMNCMVLEQQGGALVIDCGVSFPQGDNGVDVLHPRFDYLEERASRVLGVVITHGHEDHIGALPYLLDRLDVPVWAPPHALSLIRMRLEENGFAPDEVRLLETRPGQRFEVGPFGVETIRVSHSIADATALALETVAGTVIHTGDFKLDPGPMDGELTDEPRLGALGDRGVRLLLSDSTNIDAEGHTESEQVVADTLLSHVKAARGRVVIGMFASNVQRLLAVGDVAARTGRRLCLLGRSMLTHVRAAREVGRLAWPSDLVVPLELAAALPRERVLILATGTQAERMAALSKLAQGPHRGLRLERGDTVILSSRAIPGNERAVSDLVSALMRAGADVVSRLDDRRLHASGHAYRDEQRRMLELTRPASFLPVHGTLHHLVKHAALARDAGVRDALVVESGQAVELEATGPLRRGDTFQVGRVSTYRGEELPDEVVRERVDLGRTGVAFVALVLDRRGGLAAAPRVALRGLVGPGEDDVAGDVARAALHAFHTGGAEGLEERVRRAARRAIEQALDVRPTVLVTVTRLGEGAA